MLTAAAKVFAIVNQGLESSGDLTKITQLVKGSDNLTTHYSPITNTFSYYRGR